MCVLQVIHDQSKNKFGSGGIEVDVDLNDALHWAFGRGFWYADPLAEVSAAFLLISSGLYTVCCTASALAALLRHLVPGLSKRHLRTSWRGFPLRCF